MDQGGVRDRQPPSPSPLLRQMALLFPKELLWAERLRKALGEAAATVTLKSQLHRDVQAGLSPGTLHLPRFQCALGVGGAGCPQTRDMCYMGQADTGHTLHRTGRHMCYMGQADMGHTLHGTGTQTRNMRYRGQADMGHALHGTHTTGDTHSDTGHAVHGTCTQTCTTQDTH